jgi:hypothetical protein
MPEGEWKQKHYFDHATANDLLSHLLISGANVRSDNGRPFQSPIYSRLPEQEERPPRARKRTKLAVHWCE